MNFISLHSCPRSGSTWLQSIFEAHPNIKTVYQPLFSYEFKNCINENSTKEDFENFINGIKKTKDEFCCMKSNFHTNNKQTDIVRFEKEKIETVLMKHTTHHNLIETFIKLHPSIKIIGLIRDPCSVIYSQINAKYEKLVDWLDGKDKNQDKEEKFFGFNKWLEVKEIFYKIKEKYPDNIIIVNYKNLVKNTIIEIEKICEFCNLEFNENMKESIKLMNSKNEEYDYSVFKNRDTVNKWKDKLDDKITKYIKKKNFKLAIIVNLNIIKKCKNKFLIKKNLKKNFDYLHQFYFLYKSIKKYLKNINYKIYILNTIPFTKKINNVLKKMGVIVKTEKSDHPLFNRPESYIIDINCDYRMILDADTLFVSEFSIEMIDYIKSKDAMGMYGHRNFNDKYYKKICNILDIKIPKEINQTKKNPNNGQWTIKNTYKYNNKNYDIEKRLFPYFNNGAIIVKNEISNKVGRLWKKNRNKLTRLGYNNFGQNGELTIGLTINHITDNWGSLPKGFNLVLSGMTKRYQNLNVEKILGVKPILIHWQLLNINSNIYKKYAGNIINTKNTDEFNNLLK